MDRPGVQVQDRDRGQLEEPDVPNDLRSEARPDLRRSNASRSALVAMSASVMRRRVGRSAWNDSSRIETGAPEAGAGRLDSDDGTMISTRPI